MGRWSRSGLPGAQRQALNAGSLKPATLDHHPTYLGPANDRMRRYRSTDRCPSRGTTQTATPPRVTGETPTRNWSNGTGSQRSELVAAPMDRPTKVPPIPPASAPIPAIPTMQLELQSCSPKLAPSAAPTPAPTAAPAKNPIFAPLAVAGFWPRLTSSFANEARGNSRASVRCSVLRTSVSAFNAETVQTRGGTTLPSRETRTRSPGATGGPCWAKRSTDAVRRSAAVREAIRRAFIRLPPRQVIKNLVIVLGKSASRP